MSSHSYCVAPLIVGSDMTELMEKPTAQMEQQSQCQKSTCWFTVNKGVSQMRVPLAALREPEQGYKMYYMVLNIKRNIV